MRNAIDLFEELNSVDESTRIEAKRASKLGKSAMHRSYTVHSPTQIIRYGNRIEIRNVGYSLKDPVQWGAPGPRQRNPACRDFCGRDTLAASGARRRSALPLPGKRQTPASGLCHAQGGGALTCNP
ncbi:hypothetical protein [Comamonas flocculans]|uniref:Uncharacterized protein n=1 Tax=Comamonas flocculans TaxID=2597701 RepID=A0A5B8RYT6_9BURK|nr:hypothetical protein [Comamonas flocculans]QEA13944.1 hypothetical protein FOZ74_13440 [Comamonas flocculans]